MRDEHGHFALRCKAATISLAGALAIGFSLVSSGAAASALAPALVTPALAPARRLPYGKAACQTPAPPTRRSTSVPLAVTRDKTAVIAFVSACIDRHGPFPLVVDTGATSSAIDSEVAQALRLPSAGRGTKASGVSCTATVHPVRIADWSIGSLQLRGQTVESSSIPNFGLHQAPAGLLGSDVLSRFGAVRIDYQHQRLILPGPEGPAPTIKGIVRGPTTVPTPASLLAGYPAPTSIPMVVGYEADQVIAVAPVRFGRTATLAFVIDTGSSRSAISRQAAAQLGLRSQGKHQPVSGATCETTASIIKVASWSLGAKPLAGGTLLGVQIPAGEGGIEGLLGSDQLSRFGSVVIDYAGGRLLV